MNIELILKDDSKKSRLTVTPTRITLKVPSTLSEAEIEALKNASLAIYEELKPTQSWRGEFRIHGIVLATEGKKERKHFKSIA
jgi:hypothetical protein